MLDENFGTGRHSGFTRTISHQLRQLGVSTVTFQIPKQGKTVNLLKKLLYLFYTCSVVSVKTHFLAPNTKHMKRNDWYAYSVEHVCVEILLQVQLKSTPYTF